ncbi:MAG: hypothetical protein RL299_1348 [Pseudomonadota bacterium]|jgi:hypothetical protein
MIPSYTIRPEAPGETPQGTLRYAPAFNGSPQ